MKTLTPDGWMAEWDGDNDMFHFEPLYKELEYKPCRNPNWKVIGFVSEDFVNNYLDNESKRQSARACR